MKLLVLATLALSIGICSPIPALDRWQAGFRTHMLENVRDYLPSTPMSAQRRLLLREICALPDSG